ncbi:MAG: hypothetical protein IPP64_00485 [Bacteroidetes bacterium]|nr:hypothetical protein [Bacteroidota bacterium]
MSQLVHATVTLPSAFVTSSGKGTFQLLLFLLLSPGFLYTGGKALSGQ